MPNDEDLDFFDIPSEGSVKSPPSSSDEDFFDIPTPKSWVEKEAPPISEQLSHAPEMMAREGAAGVYAAPHLVGETWRYLAGKMQKLGEEQAAEQGRELTEEDKKFTDFMVNAGPDFIKWLNQKFPKVFPTYEQAKEKIGAQIEEKTGKTLPKEPRGAIERAATAVGGAAVPVLGFPGSALVKGGALATTGITEAINPSERKKIIANMSIPAILSVVESIATRRYIPPADVPNEIVERARQLGMSDTELAPILATKGQIERHGPLATGLTRTREAFEHTGEVLGNVLQDMQNRPANFTNLPNKVENTLLRRLQDIRSDIQGRTHALSPKEQTVLDFIESTITDIQNNGSSPRQLIGTWRSMNRIGAGRTEARRLAEPLLEAINSVDPQLAKDLTATNQLYSRYIGNLKELNPTAYNAFIDSGELQKFLGAVFTAEPKSITKSILEMAGLKALRHISSSILTNPNAQSLVRNFGNAVRDGRGASARALAIQLKDYVKKNLPEEYENVNWEELGIKD